jgi:DMSO/TMAO reductase YedYZ heme-binding membrane subunit
MKYYLKGIKYLQKILIFLSVLILLVVLPPLIAFNPDLMTDNFRQLLFDISFWSVFFVMMIRPLADLLPRKIPVRPLVILRKSFGILSASVVVMFLISRVISQEGYLLNYFDWEFWFSGNYKYLARIGDITAVILLITSNNFSKRILGK